jgi:uncharacterized protein
MSKHQSHPEIVKRLKRAEGHLRTVIGMIEAGRPCIDLAQQLHAIEKAIGSAKTVLIHDHIDHCLEQTIGPQKRAERAALDEFRRLTKFL